MPYQTKCKSCASPIVMMKTKSGKWCPVDGESVEEGDEIFEREKHVCHFTTCPNADEHRKRGKK